MLLTIISKIDAKLCEEFSLTKDLELIHIASYVWIKQISIKKTSINGCFQMRIFYCVLVNFSEKYSVLAVIYLFTRKTSTSCEISSNLVKTVLYLKPVSLRVLVFLAESELVNDDCIARRALLRCSYKTLFSKYAANLQENNRVEV